MLADNLSRVEIAPSLNDELISYANELKIKELHIKLDPLSGLIAVVAIHSTKLGPALGGCRCIEYQTFAAGVKDAMRLAQGMSYKSAITKLRLGGGKAVLLKPPHIANREKYFKAFGEFVETLGGRYITAVDSGTSPEDMDIIAKYTHHVTSTSKGDGDPSPYTAIGVRRGLEAAVKHKLNRDSLEGLHIAIQGLGHVGYSLAEQLHARGAKLTVTDISPSLIKKCVDKLQARAVSSEEIYAVDCDVFAPCALGAVLNADTIPRLKASIIAGAANNQLANKNDGLELHNRGILYAPDYAINAGGVINASAAYLKMSMAEVVEHVDAIYDTMLTIFARAQRENLPTNIVADLIAEESLHEE